MTQRVAILNKEGDGLQSVDVIDQDRPETELPIHNIDKSKPTIYLCGGFYGDWNEKIKESIGHSANILDPRDWRHIKDADKYVNLDLDAIDQADIVFAYRQKDNPAVGMLCEIGYAFGRGKQIYFIGEYESSRMERYYGFPRTMADMVYLSVDASIEDLQETIHEWIEANVE